MGFKQIQSKFFTSIFIPFCLFASPSHSQIIPDSSLGSQITNQDNNISIEGGTTSENGVNLFHSFQEFSVPVDWTAYFNNNPAIENIFTRVTGNSISNIEGIIKANGSANLFLINPNGIIFGNNASLDIGGSFFATTAEKIIFDNGAEFSTKNSDDRPLLTITTPIGLGFAENTGSITNQAEVLEVSSSKTLALVGKGVDIGGVQSGNPFSSSLLAEEGRIELGSVDDNVIVTLEKIDEGWKLNYPSVEYLQNINLDSTSVSSTGSSFINIQGKNIVLDNSRISIEGDFSEIDIKAEKLTMQNNSEVSIFGNRSYINIEALDSLELLANPYLENDKIKTTAITLTTSSQGKDDGGAIDINTGKLTINNASKIQTETVNTDSFSEGGDINIQASESIELSGYLIFAIRSNNSDRYKIFESNINTISRNNSNAGNINLKTDRLIIQDGAEIATTAFDLGNTGNINIQTDKAIELIGIFSSNEIQKPTGIFLNSESVENGNAGSLNLNTQDLLLTNGAQISSLSFGKGNAGILNINATNRILLSGTSPKLGFNRSSSIAVSIPVNDDISTGNVGRIIINTGELVVEKGAKIVANNFGLGNGGEAILNIDSLIVRDGGFIRAGTFLNEGNGGNLVINAKNSIEVYGEATILGTFVVSNISTQSGDRDFLKVKGKGIAGDLTISTSQLIVKDNAEINVGAIGEGQAGSLKIESNNIFLENNSKFTAETRFGDRGNIFIDTNRLTLRGNSNITTNAKDSATGGNITINSDTLSLLENSNITANAVEGNGGIIEINAQEVFRSPDSKITAISTSGEDGNVILNSPDVNSTQVLLIVTPQLVDTAKQISQACNQNLNDETANSFTVTGRGGIPNSPIEPQTENTTFATWISLPNDKITEENTIEQPKLTEDTDTPNQIVEAQGWTVDETGKVKLVAAEDLPHKYTQDMPNSCDIKS